MTSGREPSAVPLPDRYVALVAKHVEGVLASQKADGSFPSAPSFRPFHPADQTAVYPLAFLYRTQHADNPFFGDARILEAAMRVGDFLASTADERGRLHYDSQGYDVQHVDQWLYHAWLEACVLLEGELGTGRAARWRKTLHAGTHTLTEELKAWNALEGPFHTRSFETSPNHAVTRASFVYRAGMVFDEPTWRALADAFMPRFLALQDADGSWAEYEGPVVGYCLVSLGGVGSYYEYTGDARAREAVERTIGFLARAFYPDGGAVLVLDGRVQHPWRGDPRAHFALSLTPEGRALSDLLIRSTCEAEHVGNTALFRAAEDYVYWHHGVVGRVPLEEEAFTWRLKRPAGVRKAGAWMWGLSGIVTPGFPENPWSMERQTLVELYHASALCVLNGAQCKEHPEAATFASARTPGDALPVQGELDDEVSRLCVTYRTFKAALSVQAPSDGEFEVTARLLEAAPNDTVNFRVQPAAAYGTLVSAGDEERKLGEEAWEVEGVRELSWGGVTVRFDAPARVWWPFKGYNSYSADHTYGDLSSARLIAEVPLRAESPLCGVKVRVAG